MSAKYTRLRQLEGVPTLYAILVEILLMKLHVGQPGRDCLSIGG